MSAGTNSRVTRAALRGRPVRALALAAVLVVGLLSALPLAAPAATSVAFTPTDDTFAHSEYPSTTHGSLAEFRVDGSPVLNGYLRFDVSGLTGPVTRATLKLYSRTSHSDGFEVRSVSSSGWTEATLTYANAPAPSTTVTAQSGAITAGTWAALDVTRLVTGNGAVAFALTTTSGTNLPLAAKEGGAATAPQLVVETSASSSGSTSPSTTAPTTTNAPTTTTTPPTTTTTTTTPTTTTTTTTSAPPPTTTTAPQPDTSPPTAPRHVRATGATTTSVSVSWRASRDDVGVAGYGVYIDGSAAGSTSQTSFTASGLACGRSYVVTVDAYDAAGNRSPKSSPLTVATSACPPDTQAPGTPGNLRVTGSTASSVAVAWNASTDNVGVTGYNVYRDGSFVASTTATSYSFSGLSCGTSYTFGVEALDAAGNRSSRATVTTATAACPAPPPSSGDPVIAIAGDIAGDGSGDSATAALLDSLNPTAVLTAGDNAYPDGTLSQYNAYYDPTWGRHKAKTYPSPGNHEYHTSGASGYFSYFGSRAGPSAKGFYSYNLGAWHLIALNSEISTGATSEQVTWLKNDLASTSAKCVMAYWHKPRFTAGNYSDNAAYQPFWEALYAANADVVIGGHDHNYQRYVPMTPTGTRDDARGIREFVVGTGGRSHYGLRADSRREAANSGTYGVLKLTLRATGYDWQFVPEAGRSYTDAGSGACH
jgi:acid phosphatase type 7